MITPQDIREKQFERAMLNGYSTVSVDQFMEQVATEYAALCKEISTYRKKMKMLVEKVEEYRASEDAMRMTLLQAQKTCKELTEAAQTTAQTTISDAQAQADALFAKATEKGNAILASAQQQYDDIVSSISDAADLEEARLAKAQQNAALFLERMRGFCNSQLIDLDSFEAASAPNGSKPSSEDIPDEAFVEKNSTLEEKLVTEGSVVEELSVIEEEEPALEDAPVVEEEEKDPLASLMGLLNTDENSSAEDDDDTKRFNFDDLKGLNFGR